ncbi:RipA family octameric membrane protein [Gracilimonas sp. BCB1]|uniref:RipA family octameric membrane protein n=1 Tax=Gracilimonas sp. BCB1 TaxID=3152362 RepID=UPI0032D96776
MEKIADTIKSFIPEERLPEDNYDELFVLYAVLLRAKGKNVTQSDIHDAWSAWMNKQDQDHNAILPYEDLEKNVQDQDNLYAVAVRKAAEKLNLQGGSGFSLNEVLFPTGPPKNIEEKNQAFDLYKIMVNSSESLVERRQSVNTFFLTMNGAILTAYGLIVKSSGGDKFSALGIFVLAIAGAILCVAWRSLITSFGQLNRGKFEVINTIEQYLKAAIYAAEWEALGRGENPKIYRSFTSREIWVPNALILLHVITALVALTIGADLINMIKGWL